VTTPLFSKDRRGQQLRKLTEVSRALTYAVSLEEVLGLAVNRAAELLDADKAVLMLANDDGLLSVSAAHGLDKATCERFREPLHETLVTRLQGLFGDADTGSFLGVPLVVRGEVIGILAVARPRVTANLDEEEWLLSALADQAAVALEKTRLDETAEFRERLIGIVSHDLRNPIFAIKMAVELLLAHSEADERTIKTALRIRSSADRATRLIEDLLDFTRARLGGGIQIEPKATDLHFIVRQVVDELEVAHPERRIMVTHESDGRGDWDPDRLAQVLGNLIANALHYSPPDSVVRVATQDVEHDVVITVHNRGTPIPPERLPHVFEPLQRATSELTNSTRSVGLGLYIVRQLVEAHSGKVSVESTEQNGTTMTVRLPRRRA
jgi:sigma-B regulation protein RsbU (phosphoserine phosphatase)